MTVDEAREQRTVRRGLGAGAVVWVLLGAVLAVSQLVAGRGAGGALAGVLLGLVFGLLVASAWLLLALLLDSVASHPVGSRRMKTTVAVVAATMVSPVLVLAVGG